MANGKRKTSTTSDVEGREKRKKRAKTATQSERIAKLLTTLESRIDAGEEVKISVTDYIRLLQLQKEYEQDAPRDIEVTWVESASDRDATDE